jgi:hypothetical protein
MRKEAVIVTLDEQLQQRRILEEQKEKQQSVAMAKKKKMMELEEIKKGQNDLNDLEKEAQDKKGDLLNQAREKLNEQLDEVKHMNQMVFLIPPNGFYRSPMPGVSLSETNN